MNRILIALLTLAISGCTTTSASAGWPHDQFENQPRVHRHYRPAKRHHHKPRTKVIYRNSAAPTVAEPHCLPAVVVPGKQWVTESGAREAALDAWIGLVRWHHGEKYMDPNRAKNVTYQCNRSSVGDFMDKVYHRCLMRAQPCIAPWEGADK